MPHNEQSGRERVTSSESTLYREECLEAAPNKLEGAVILASPVSVSVISAATIVVLLAVLLSSAIVTYARQQAVRGRLMPSAGLINIRPPQSGIITVVHARPGQTVKQGDIIAELSATTDLHKSDSSKDAMDALIAQQSALSERAHLNKIKYRDKAQEFRLRITNLQEQMAESQRSIASRLKLLTLAQEDLARAEPAIQRGFVSKSELTRRQIAVVQAEEGVAEAKSTILVLRSQLDSAQLDLKNAATDMSDTQAANDSALAELTQKISAIGAQSSFVLRAPISGMIGAINVAPGDSVAPSLAVASVISGSGHMVAELFVPSSAAGFLVNGQEVGLVFDAYPIDRYGITKARIIAISAAPLSPEEIRGSDLGIKEPVFRVIARFAPQTRSRFDANDLRVGMLLTGNIVLERRTLLSWALVPLQKAVRSL